MPGAVRALLGSRKQLRASVQALELHHHLPVFYLDAARCYLELALLLAVPVQCKWDDSKYEQNTNSSLDRGVVVPQVYLCRVALDSSAR